MNDAAPSTNYSIGPGAIATPGTTGGPGFIMSKAEWLTIQTYVTDALALPTTSAELKNLLGSGAPADMSVFDDLVTAYAAINTHCATWKNTTYPNTVSLASSIYEYGTNTAPIYYPPIVTQANILITDPNNATAKATLKAIIDALQGIATGYVTQAKAASAAVKAFADQTTADGVTLVGPHGSGGLYKTYNDKYGTTSKEVESLTKDITAQTLALKGYNEEYNRDVTIASTTATYAWIFPEGTIAAAVVAGIYGHRAVEALENAHATQEKIDNDNAEIAADANLMNALNSATLGISSINTALQAALPVLELLEGVWQSMADDLSAISTLIDKRIEEVPPIIAYLGVDSAIQSWAKVATYANNYRVNAFVQPAAGSPSMMAARVNRLLIGPESRRRRLSY